jgi:hypothetical protein
MIHERSRQVEKFPKCSVVHERGRERGRETWPRAIPPALLTPTFGLAFAVLAHHGLATAATTPLLSPRRIVPRRRFEDCRKG